MPDMVIMCMNVLGSNQLEQLVFTNWHSHLISNNDSNAIQGVLPEYPTLKNDETYEADIEDDVELPGVDVDNVAEEEQQNQTPQTVEIDDLDITKPNPAPIQSMPGNDDPDTVCLEPVPASMENQEETPHLCRSTQIKMQPKNYVPSLKGLRYTYAIKCS